VGRLSRVWWTASPRKIMPDAMSAASGCDRTSRPPSLSGGMFICRACWSARRRRTCCPPVFDTSVTGRMLYFPPMDKIAGDYRIFVGAFPTGELAERIQAVRLRHDAKTARVTAPHVTVAGTYWRSGPAKPENESDTIARLQAGPRRPSPAAGDPSCVGGCAATPSGPPPACGWRTGARRGRASASTQLSWSG